MNKIRHQNRIFVFYAVVFSIFPVIAFTQECQVVQNSSVVISKPEELYKTTVMNTGKVMTDLKKNIPRLLFDLRYTTINNFMGVALYPAIHTTWMRKTAADSLKAVQVELAGIGLGLKIFDAYRPYSVTQRMWEKIHDERYVADPKKGSGHNRGIAVDLSIVRLKTGEELEMGTVFDDFSDSAHLSFTGLPAATLGNRLLLRRIMEKHGFKALETEWWHFSLQNAKDFELLDIPFTYLMKPCFTKQ